MDQLRTGRLAIVIVNWNSGRWLRRCLESMSNCEHLDRVSQVVVIDNDSHDNSCDELPTMEVPFCVIRNDSNRGFAVACNQGARYCHAEYLLFLNPDTELRANSIAVPLEFLDDPCNRDVGICGIQLLDHRGQVARSCSRLPTSYNLLTRAWRLHCLSRRLFPPQFLKEWDHSETRVVEQIIGAFFLVRTPLYEQLSGFDERFFVYFEEVDFCERTRQLGIKTVYLSSAQARHVGGGCSIKDMGRAHFFLLRSRMAYAKKHFSRWQSILIDISTLIAEPFIHFISYTVRLKWKKMRLLFYTFGLLWHDRIRLGDTGDHSVMCKELQTRTQEVTHVKPPMQTRIDDCEAASAQTTPTAVECGCLP